MSKTPTVAWLTALLGVGLLAGISAYQFGLEEGRKQGKAAQEARSQLAHNLTNAVYLTLAAKKEEAGEIAQAEQLRQLLLYSSALEMQHAVDSGQLSPAELSRTPTAGVLDEVAAYFRRHPDSLTAIEQDPSRRHLIPELKALMDRHDPANQAD
jgi:hypothetical protein